jgi:hypothetical protein
MHDDLCEAFQPSNSLAGLPGMKPAFDIAHDLLAMLAERALTRRTFRAL